MTDLLTIVYARIPHFVPAPMSPLAYRLLEDSRSASVAIGVEVGGAGSRCPDLLLADLASSHPSKCTAYVKLLVIINQQGEKPY